MVIAGFARNVTRKKTRLGMTGLWLLEALRDYALKGPRQTVDASIMSTHLRSKIVVRLGSGHHHFGDLFGLAANECLNLERNLRIFGEIGF